MGSRAVGLGPYICACFFLVKFEYELNLTSSLVSRLWFTRVINAISHICICIVSAHLWLHHPRTFNAVCRSGRPFFFYILIQSGQIRKARVIEHEGIILQRVHKAFQLLLCRIRWETTAAYSILTRRAGRLWGIYNFDAQ